MILLDSNALLWLITADRRLGPRGLAMLQESGASIFVSPVSFVELTIKQMLGKLELRGPLGIAAVAAGLRELPMTTAHAAAVEAFPALIRHDPFDRMLLAQAKVEGMRLLTSDRMLLVTTPELTLDARA